MLSFAGQFLFRITRPDVLRMRAILIGESPRFPELATQFYEQAPSVPWGNWPSSSVYSSGPV